MLPLQIFKAGFGADCENVVLTVGENGGNGIIENIEIQADTKDNTYKKYLENQITINHILIMSGVFIALLVLVTVINFVYIKKKIKK